MMSPENGPVTGGTTVTIQGENLGRALSDISSLTVAGVPCNLQSYDVQTGTVVCETGAASGVTSGTVSIGLVSSQSNTSTFEFSYLEPTVTSFTPTSAPTSGGTSITITGELGIDASAGAHTLFFLRH